MSEDSTPPSEAFEEDTTLNGTEELPKPMKRWAQSHSRRVRTIEKHFEKGGLAYETHMTIETASRSFNFWLKVGPILGALIVAV